MTTLSGVKPDRFDSYWQETLDGLAKLPPAPEVEEIPLRSTDFATAYGVRLTSIGPYRLFGYLSIPNGSGPFPAKYFLPRYGSVVDLVPQGTANGQRREYVTFAVAVRGQRLSDQPYAASFPGLLTDGIDDLDSYVYRGIVVDCCRGLEYLAGRPEVDGTRIAAIGTDLALTTAALCPQATHVVCTPALSYAAADLAPRTSAYPLEEINDYLRLHPSRREQVSRTLSYFDLRWFAPRVNAPTLLMAGSDGAGLAAATLEPLVEALGGECQVHESEHSGFKDGVYSEEWLTRQFGLAAPSLPPHWQP
jgi:cephalosporin-C deacetylase